MTFPDIIGTWTLESYRLIGSRGRIRYPYGKDAAGYLLYLPDGFMAVSIMSSGRREWVGEDIRRQTEHEAAAATRTYLSYCGTYEVLPDRVVHAIRTSLFPNWTGTRQERFYRLSGSCLELSTSPWDGERAEPRAHLQWRRADHKPR
jgi:hypothetical protein